MPELKSILKTILFQTENESGWIEIYDCFGMKLNTIEFDNNTNGVKISIPIGEYYFFLRGNRSLLYSKVIIDENGNYNLNDF